MSGVAVDKGKLPGLHGMGLPRCLQVEGALLHIHQQEAVKGFPGEAVPGLVYEPPALQWVEKHFLGVPTGGIYEVAGFRRD